MIKFLFMILVSCQAMATEYVVRGHINLMTTSGINVVRNLKYFDGFVAELTDAQANSLKAEGYKIEVNGRVHIMGQPSVLAAGTTGIPWGTKAVKAPEANKLANGSGEGVTICVVDTGAGTDVPDLAGVYLPGVAIVKTTATGKEDWYDDMGHGTHVSGTIAAKADPDNGVQGVAPKVKIFPVKVLDAQGSGTDADVADGIKACIGHASILSMSLGGGDAALMKEAVEAAQKAGITVVAAAGNDGGPVIYPAAYKGVLAVSAVDSDMKIASFSNFGPEISYAAPGVKVRSTIPGGFATWDGTSMATPHVAAVLAISQSRKTQLKARDIGLTKEQQGNGFIDAELTAVAK